MNSGHQGKIVEQIIRDSGYTLVHVAAKMEVSRNTLYNRFREPEVPPLFLFKLGRVINYDFTKVIPSLSQDVAYMKVKQAATPKQSRYSQALIETRSRYYKALEEYNKLLKFLVRIINDNQLYKLKTEIEVFTNKTYEG